MSEQWLAIPDWEGYYEASDQGRIKSLARIVPRTDGVIHPLKERILKQTPDSHGRLTVGLHRNSTRRIYRVSTLVLITFVGPRPDGMEACHWDDCDQNNWLYNLRWDTRAKNIADRYRNGRDGQSKRRATMARKLECRNGHARIPANRMNSRDECRLCHCDRERERRGGSRS